MDVLLLERIPCTIISHVFEHTSNIKHQKEIYRSVNNGYTWMTEPRVILISLYFPFSAASLSLLIR